jgi:hypothetical protein
VSRRIDWPAILDRASVIVRSYDTSVTLRQLFYRLVSQQVLPNTRTAYKGLSRVSAEARRAGEFPDLIDLGRVIHRYQQFGSPEDAMAQLIGWYRLDRTRGQDVSLYLGVEKAGTVMQMQSWFGELGIPIVAVGGYSSQSYVGDVVGDAESADRPAVLLYAGDFDSSGEDITRDFLARTGCWAKVVKVALSHEQVQEYRLPINPGKPKDSRAAGFIARHGELMQVELDALDPDDLHQLFTDAIDAYWDTSAYRAVLEQEARDLPRLQAAADSLEETS